MMVAEAASLPSQTSFFEVLYDRVTDLVSIRARNATLEVLLKEVAQRANLEIDLREEAAVGYRVSVALEDLPLEPGLRKLLQGFNAAFLYSSTFSEANDSTVARLVRVVVLSKKAIQAPESSGARDEPRPEAKPNGSREDRRLDSTELLRRIVEGKGDDVKSLVRALREPGRDEERERMVEALNQRLDNGYFPPLDSVIVALKELAPESAIATLTERLQDSNPRVRAMAAATLGRLQDERAIDALVSALYETDPAIRQAAATSLAHIGGARAMEALFQMYMAGDNGVRYPIAVAIRSHGDEKSQRLLVAITAAGHGATEPAASEIAVENPNRR